MLWKLMRNYFVMSMKKFLTVSNSFYCTMLCQHGTSSIPLSALLQFVLDLFFFHSCAAVDQILIDTACHTVHLRQYSILLVLPQPLLTIVNSCFACLSCSFEVVLSGRLFVNCILVLSVLNVFFAVTLLFTYHRMNDRYDVYCILLRITMICDF